jgi:hypothetical protein
MNDQASARSIRPGDDLPVTGPEASDTGLRNLAGSPTPDDLIDTEIPAAAA